MTAEARTLKGGKFGRGGRKERRTQESALARGQDGRRRGSTGGSAAGRRWRMRRGGTFVLVGAVLERRSSIRVVLSRAVGAADNECPARVHHREVAELNHPLLPRAEPCSCLMYAQRTGVKLRAPEGASLRATDGDRQLQRSVGLRRGQSGWGRVCREHREITLEARTLKGGKFGRGGRKERRTQESALGRGQDGRRRGSTGGSAAGRRWRMRRGEVRVLFGAVLERRSSIRVVLSRGAGAADNECPARVHHRDDPELNNLLPPPARGTLQVPNVCPTYRDSAASARGSELASDRRHSSAAIPGWAWALARFQRARV